MRLTIHQTTEDIGVRRCLIDRLIVDCGSRLSIIVDVRSGFVELLSPVIIDPVVIKVLASQLSIHIDQT